MPRPVVKTCRFDAGGELQRAADEVARRRRGVDQAARHALVAQLLARREHADDRRAAAT